MQGTAEALSGERERETAHRSKLRDLMMEEEARKERLGVMRFGQRGTERRHQETLAESIRRSKEAEADRDLSRQQSRDLAEIVRGQTTGTPRELGDLLGRKPTLAEVLDYEKKSAEAKRDPATPGVDVPFSGEVEAQKRRIATAGAAARDAAREPEIEIAARAIIEPRNLMALREISSLRGDQRLKIFARAKTLDPNFDPGLVNQRIRFLQAYEDPKGRASINRQAINNILQHAGDLSELNQAYRFGGLRGAPRVLNTPINALARQGSTAYVEYATTLGVLKDELTLYFAGGYAPVEKQHEMWQKILNEDATPAQVEAFAKTVIHLSLRRATTFDSQFKKNMGYADPNMIVPEAKEAGQKLGLGSELNKFGSGGRLTGATGRGGEGIEEGTTRRNRRTGEVQEFRAGKWVQISPPKGKP